MGAGLRFGAAPDKPANRQKRFPVPSLSLQHNQLILFYSLHFCECRFHWRKTRKPCKTALPGSIDSGQDISVDIFSTW
jgi:hypothetical protein